jgi:DNA invertase Pin-like site-specific DNA recombinase
MIYGYARVSTDGQSVEAQVAALTAAGAVKVYLEVASGAKTDRAQLRQVLAKLAAGDVLLVTRLDRLARSTRDLLNTLAAITTKAPGLHRLGMPGPTPRPRTAACCSPSSAAWPSSSAS